MIASTRIPGTLTSRLRPLSSRAETFDLRDYDATTLCAACAMASTSPTNGFVPW